MNGKTLKQELMLEIAGRTIRSAGLSLSPAWKDSLLTFFAGRFFYTLIGLYIWWTKFRPPYADYYYFDIDPVLNGPAGALLGVWQRWDGIHYLRIATNGYSNDHISLFYPLFPLLGSWLTKITHWDTLLTMQLVSNTAFLLCLVLLHKIVSQHFSEKTARLTLVGMVIFPSSFYFYAIFPQSLLLLLFLITYDLLRRGCWAGAVVTAFLAGLTHSTAVALSVLVGIEALQFLWPRVIAFREKRFVFEWSILPVLVAPFANMLGFASFMVWREIAGFPSYYELQAGSYARAITMPWDGLAAIFQSMIHLSDKVTIPYVAWMNSACFLLMVFLTIWSFRRIPWSWWFLQMGFLVFITMNVTVGYPLLGFIRYSLSIFPMFVGISMFGQQPRWQLLKFGLGLILAFIYSASFFLWVCDMS